DDDRVNRHVRLRAVPTAATNRDVYRIHVGQDVAWRATHSARLESRIAVQRDSVLRLGEPLEQAILEHGQRPATSFFGRLTHEHYGPFPAVARIGEQPGSAYQNGHVHVMAASVHDTHRVTFVVLGRYSACVRQASGLG